MAVIATIIAGLGYASAIVSEPWLRYFVIVAGLAIGNVVGEFTGIYVLEGLISHVVVSVFGLTGFFIPTFYGVSALLILAVAMPFIFLMIRMLIQR